MAFTDKKYWNFLLILIIFFSLLSPLFTILGTAHDSSISSTVDEIHIAVILEGGSWMGKILDSCISMAISDVYSLNSHYRTKLLLHSINSEGDPFRALSQSLVLMKNVELQAIIVAETSRSVDFLAELGTRAKIPIVSLFAAAASLSSSEYPYLIHMDRGENIRAKAIAALANFFSWREVILICDENDSGRLFLSNMVDSFQDTDIKIARSIAISSSSTDEEIVQQLRNIMTLHTAVYVVHMSPSLASNFFLNAKRIGMMGEGFAWIATDMVMNFFHLMNSSVVESMQGVLGFKPYIPESKELYNLTSRCRRKFFIESQDIELIELNVYGIWMYDTIWALASAAERVLWTGHHPTEVHPRTSLNMMDLATIKFSSSGSMYVNEIAQSRFKGITGVFQLLDGESSSKGFEIVNVVGKVDRRIGYHTTEKGITKTINQELKNSTSSSKLEAVIWPGGSVNVPKGWSLQGKRLKIAVPIKKGFNKLIDVILDPQTNTTIVTGFCKDVFNAAVKTLGYEIAYDFVPCELKVISYSDLIYQVYLQKYDAVVGDITITANRSLYVDFTMPYTDLGVAMIVPRNNNNMWIFLKPLTGDLWITSACFFVFTGFVVWLIESPINPEFQGPPAQQIGMVFWYSFSTLVFAHSKHSMLI